MLNQKSFLAADFGAGSLKVAQFEITDAGGLRLKQYALKSLGQEGAQESTRETAMVKALQGLLSENSFSTKHINVCAPGFHVFSKFVKLPQVDTSKVTQIIQYEAQQNVPFPLEDVVWDYQILGTMPSGELEVLLVAIKSEIVEGLFRVGEGAGLKLDLVDVSPAALCNAFRYNYGDQEGCTMLLDIGAKTSNLLFFEKGKIYSRSINIGANSITQDFATEAKLPFGEAERAKIEKGFVSLGGAYEEPEDPQAAAISKIARQVMTRLHMQVNQTIQFYRGQQGGSAPLRLFLSGGASIMPYTAQFFNEKLNIPVDYFNPFRNVQFDAGVNLEELSKIAHSFGEVVGLGLRNLAHCPVELNLMPKSSLQKQELAAKKPFFVATAAVLVAGALAFAFYEGKLTDIKATALDQINAKVDPLKKKSDAILSAKNELDKKQSFADTLSRSFDNRVLWANTLQEFRKLMIAIEQKQKEESGKDVGVWIEKFEPILPGYMAGDEGSDEPEMDEAMMKAYGLTKKDILARRQQEKGPPNEISRIRLIFRGVNVAEDLNAAVTYRVLNTFKDSGFFEKDAIRMTTSASPDPQTFSFNMEVKLKKSFKF
ncbi:MAG: Type pilus assembly protein PilM [Verrucomicrobiales bacterium]|nr:Type pilus assembly protein PilM [Verrucomicrobiales bacterium]